MTSVGRPQFEPTAADRKQVSTLTAFGVPIEEVCAVVGISANTLRKHFSDELATGHVKANARVAGCLYEKAIGGDVTSMIFWLKTRAKWREVPREYDIKQQVDHRQSLDLDPETTRFLDSMRAGKGGSGGEISLSNGLILSSDEGAEPD